MSRKRGNVEDEGCEKKMKVGFDTFTTRFAYTLDLQKRTYLEESKKERATEKLQLSMGKSVLYKGCDELPIKLDDELTTNDLCWASSMSNNFNEQVGVPMESKTQEMFNAVASYMDLLAIVDDRSHRDIYVGHCLNHLIKTRNVVVGNNKKLQEAKLADNVTEDLLEKARDQGFVRPSILILCPFKKDAYDIVNRLKSILFGDKKGDIMNNARFEKEFESGVAEFNEYISEDHKELLSGNNDDCFRVGIALSKKALKMYEPFDKSDILLCSPLGLRMILEKEGENAANESHLVSSLQIVIVDNADILLQQNWEHLHLIFQNMHNQPSKINTDISRVRQLYLDGDSKFYGQLMLFAKYQHEYFAGLVLEKSFNYRGLLMNQPFQKGTLSDIEIPLCQELHRFNIDSGTDPSDARFKYFRDKFSTCLIPHTCVVVPSYFDFVRIRNYFKRQEESFVACHEYASEKKIKRARDLFYHEEKSVLLITERFHFFNRRRIKGIKRLIFYQIPSHPLFYSEFINMGQLGDNRFLSSLIYSKHDRLRLINTFGSDMAISVLNSDKPVQAIVSE